MTGNARMVGEEISLYCNKKNINNKVFEMDEINASFLSNNTHPIIICSSTYGQGEVPDNAISFYKELKKAEPDLSHIKYALFGLGDSTYKDTFAFGGKKLDKLFLSLKAKPIGTSYFHDASESTLPEDEGLKWFKENIINKLFI